MASSQTKKPFNLHKWLRSRKGQQAIIIVLFMIVPVTLLLLFTYYPFAEMFKFSFYKMKYVGTRTFVGLKTTKKYLQEMTVSGHCGCPYIIWVALSFSLLWHYIWQQF